VLDRKRGGPFTPLTKELLSTLAATAALILDRASQYEQVERRAAWLESMRRVEKLVITSDNELEVWSEIANCLRNLTSSGTVALQVPDRDDMHVLVAVGSSAEFIVGRSYPKEESHGWQAMQKGRGQVVAGGARLPLKRHTFANPELVGPVMSVPLVGGSGPRGAVSLVRELGQPPFSDSDLEIVEDFARQATVALEMAEARSAWVRMHDAETREAIARDLHDDVMQRLFAVGLSLQGVAQAEPAAMKRLLERTVQDLDATIVQIRETIFTLRRPA
jgi:signal transduction histidine kinase